MLIKADPHATELYNQWHKKRLLRQGLIIVTVGLMSLGALIIPRLTLPKNSPTSSDHNQITNQTLALPKGTPDYDTLLPANKTIDSLGGWTLISPTNSNPVYSYADSISNTSITVSQQPLPGKFVSSPESEVMSLAASSGATRQISSGNTKIYIAAKANGPQSLFLTKNNLLILIKSTATISDDQWIAYVSSLQ